MGKIYDRKKQEVYVEEQYQQKLLEFLYHCLVGRALLKVVTMPFFSRVVGKYYDTKRSTKKIQSFVEENHIDLSLYEEKEYDSFNDFFTRKKKNISFSQDDEVFCSPADAKLMVYKITEDLTIKVKQCCYTLAEMLQVEKDELENFQNGNCLIFRLAVDDYHRYHFIDDGEIMQSKYIKGKLHTVRSISEKYRVYVQNCRACHLLRTVHFGEMYEIEVGAVLVGKIVNREAHHFQKGEEKGYFEYGGSTVILLTKDNIQVDEDILQNSERDIETKILVGEKIGKRKKEDFS